MSKNTRNRILLTAIAALLLVAVAVGGTMAYLQATSGPVENTFTPSEVGVNIVETKGDTFQFVPGVNIEKDPKVTATADVNCYVFAKVTKQNWPDASVELEIADGWEDLVVAGDITVYYRACEASETNKLNQTWSVIKNDTIEVGAGLTVEDMKNMGSDPIKLTFDAYIIQQAGFGSPEAAWNEVGKTPAATVPAE